MDFDWASVKYIFQVPLEWFKSIHRRVFNAYGSNFIKVKEGYYGGMEIGLDTDELDQYINGKVGSVSSVDGVGPDANGNVELGAARLAENQTFTGNNTFSNSVALGNSGAIGDNGTSLDISHGQNGISLNGTNAQLLVNEPSRLYSDGADAQIASRAYCRLNFARILHTHGNINSDGTITTIGSGITTDYIIGATSTGELYRKQAGDFGLVKSVNSQPPDANGNVTLDIPDTSSIVYTVNGIAPTNGNVNLGAIVYAVNGVTPVDGNVTISIPSGSGVTMSQVEAYVEAQNFATETYVDTALTNYVDAQTLTATLQDYALLTDLDDYALLTDLDNYAQSVDGHYASNGSVDFGLSANKWVKADAQGHLSTTDEVPIAMTSSDTGYLYANAGTLEFKTGEFVTLSTSQIITGAKTITNNDLVMYDQAVFGTGSSGTTTAAFNKNGLTIADFQTTNTTRVVEAGLQVVDNTTGNYGYVTNTGVVVADGSTYNAASLTKTTLEIKDNSTGNGTTIAKNGILLDYSGAFFGLRTPNTTANDAFITLDQNNNNQLAFSSPNGIKGTSPYFGFNGFNNSHVHLTPDYGAIEIVPSPQSGVGGYIDFHLNGQSASYTSRIIETATGSQQVPNQLYVTSKGNTIVQTETSGNKVFLIADSNNVALWNQPTDTSTNSLAVATVGYIQTKFQNAQTTNVNCVTGVSWNGTQIVITSQTLGFTNGLLTSVTNNATGYINTVAYAP